MGLRQIAESDLAQILEDDVSGFGWPITITDPLAVTQNLIGYSNDIAQLVDPNTGEAASGRIATVAVRISTLVGALPRGISSSTQKPWLVTFNDINGNTMTFKVQDSDPDRALGILVLTLEFWRGV